MKIRKVLILGLLLACTAFVSSETADASLKSCSEVLDDFSNANWAYHDAYINHGTNSQEYASAEVALFSASAAVAGPCQMEQTEFCPGAYTRAAQCNTGYGWYMSAEDPDYSAFLYNQYMACMEASGYYSCV